MKLELKHLAPYLPYGLECLFNVGPHFNNELNKLSTSNIWYLDKDHSGKIQPFLRPLSDLKEFSPAIYEFGYLENSKIINRMPYLEVQFLLEHHFDVFGLIQKGLAIDKNTLKSEAI